MMTEGPEVRDAYDVSLHLFFFFLFDEIVFTADSPRHLIQILNLFLFLQSRTGPGERGAHAFLFLFLPPFFSTPNPNATPLEVRRTVRRSAIFQPAIGSPDDFERPRLAGVIKFRIFFKFLRFHSDDLARGRSLVVPTKNNKNKRDERTRGEERTK